jgi:hypothetical protein
MFILDTDQIPATTQELTRAITSSLKKSIRLPTHAVPVKITGNLPSLSTMTVDVSMGEVDTTQPLPDPKPPKDQQPGPTAESITLSGDPIVVEKIPIQFLLSAKKMSFAYGRNRAGQLVATPRDASDGHLSIQLFQNELNLALLTIARRFAGKHGVKIIKVETSLTSLSPTDLKLLLKITAKKFMTAVVEIAGRVRIDDGMVATATDLKATSSGMVGTVAVNLLQPQLTKLEGQPLQLMAFSLGNLKLRGVAVDTTDGLHFTAKFGSEPS